MIDDWPEDLLSECYHIDPHHAVAKLLYLLHDKESDKISMRCFLIFKTNYWQMAWQLQLRVLYSHKARFVNQPKAELYLNFLEYLYPLNYKTASIR